MRDVRARLLPLLIAVLCAAPALAQRQPQPGAIPLTIVDTVEPQRPPKDMMPLSGAQLDQLRRAQGMINNGQIDRAREELAALNAAVPHHALVLSEYSRVLVMKSDWAAVERLARAERAQARDSVLLGRDLTLALEREAHWKDGAQVVIEVWAADPDEEDWATMSLARLSVGDAKAVREVMRRGCLARPARADFARESARLEIANGDVRPALKALATAEHADGRSRVRWAYSDQLLAQRAPRDSTAAIEVLLDFAGDQGVDPMYRTVAARRTYDVSSAQLTLRDVAPRIQKALSDLPPERWGPDLRLGIARGLREGGHTAEARALLDSGTGAASPAFVTERALNDLREGPPARALPGLKAQAAQDPESAYRYAEALFFSGQIDSAHTWYQAASTDPRAEHAGAALERLYLLEEPSGHDALPAFGRLAYEDWRGNRPVARAIADSLYRTLSRSPIWAYAAILSGNFRAAAGDPRGALEPFLALADSLPDDRLAPLARQRAGDIYLDALKDERAAAQQYEACLTRYPRAWNAPEVRRRLDQLRRERRL